jgi:hypothetical protein
MLYNSTHCPPFTLEQLTALATWNLVRPAGLGVRIAQDHERFPEVAMLFRHDPEDVRYLMNPTSRGTVVLVRSSGGKWALPTVEAALAKVLALEKGDLAVTKAGEHTMDVGAAPQARP